MIDRHTVWILCLGVVGILAIAVAAPALPTAVSVVEDDGIDSPELSEDAESLLDEQFGEAGGDDVENPLPVEWLLLGAGLISLLVLGRAVVANPEQARPLLFGTVAIAALLGALLVFDWSGYGNETTGTGSGPGLIPESFPLAVAILVAGLTLIGTVFVLSRDDTPALETADDSADIPTPSPANELSASDYGSSAVSHTAADTDVYRTWLLLNAAAGTGDESAATPGEVRDEAIASGLDRSAVDELIHLFEASRYGRHGPTQDQDQRARALCQELALESNESNESTTAEQEEMTR
ncbi:DUF4129 domain protein (plasmid) [Natrialba magadii ATCC 43099]|uniref:DUF4129 domain protein n=1 Tax=Natrialba magadii (strain ATCC 43099 / DSM 3394 / CCM 3739 / CIP 104546 / IAM 13178 / JCM 8861 / NBRC 102185 / NCIMB 2190 / MS3) TaxID=547559 RepID=D3T1M9_NATMM|nr:DUF4129 domain-containing protein [Natrialba magadii]ADD07488.1 DUF4129 domain protein [Natrialba magadii ATCC 43099]ELY32206.1 hypothetical protein C500_04434 [Natrialba magadii ATCC 43099]